MGYTEKHLAISLLCDHQSELTQTCMVVSYWDCMCYTPTGLASQEVCLHHKHVSNALCYVITATSWAHGHFSAPLPCNLIGPLLYIWSIVDPNVPMRHKTVKTQPKLQFALFKICKDRKLLNGTKSMPLEV